MADADVREAGPSDAAEIARIQVSTWRSAYRDLLPTEVLDELDETRTEQQWLHALTEGPVTVLLATEGQWTVGFCAAGVAPEEEASAADGAAPADLSTLLLVSSLLVEPRWGRRGHGGRLLGFAAQRFAAAGATRGICWIPEADEASMAFFRGVGWDPDGTVRTLDAGGRPVREIRLSGGLDLRFEQG